MPVPTYTFDTMPNQHPGAPNAGMLIPVPSKLAMEAVRRKKRAGLASQRSSVKKSSEIPYHGIRSPAEAHVMARMMIAKHRSLGYHCADPPTADAAIAQAQMLMNSQQFDLHINTSGADKTLSVHTDLNVGSVEYWNSLNHELANNHSVVNSVNKQAIQSCVCPEEDEEKELKFFSCVNCRNLCSIGSNFCQHCGCDHRIGAVRDAACSAIGFSSNASSSSASSFSMVSRQSRNLSEHAPDNKKSILSSSSFINPVQPISRSSVGSLSAPINSKVSNFSSKSTKPDIVREDESLPPTPQAIVDPYTENPSPGSPASKKNTACALDNDCVSLSSAGHSVAPSATPSAPPSNKLRQPASRVSSHPSSSTSSSSAPTSKSSKKAPSNKTPGTPVNSNSQVVIKDPYSMEASPGSPASKKNTACDLDNDCINLDTL